MIRICNDCGAEAWFDCDLSCNRLHLCEECRNRD